MSRGKRLRTRRGGRGAERGGGACVARARGCRRSWDQDEGDASVPTPPNSTPAPTDTIHAFPQIPTPESSAPAPTDTIHAFPQIPARVSGGSADVGWGHLHRPCAPTSGLSKGLPASPQDGASPIPTLHWLRKPIRCIVGTAFAVVQGAGSLCERAASKSAWRSSAYVSRSLPFHGRADRGRSRGSRWSRRSQEPHTPAECDRRCATSRTALAKASGASWGRL